MRFIRRQETRASLGIGGRSLADWASPVFEADPFSDSPGIAFGGIELVPGLDALLEATSSLDGPLTLATLNHWHQRLFGAGPDAGGLPPFFCTGCTDGQMVDINGWLRNGCVRQHQDERFRANPTAPPRTRCSTPAAQSARFSGMGRKKLRSRMAAEKAAITPIKPTAFLYSLCLYLRSSGFSAHLTSTPPVRSRSVLKSALGSLIQMLTRVSRWSSLTNWRVDPPSSRSLTSR